MFIGRGCTCAFLSRGTLRALPDFSPLRRSYQWFAWWLWWSLTSSFCVVMGWSLTFLMIILTPWGEILHGAPDRGRLMVILYFFHFRINRTNSCLLLIKLLADGLVAHSSLVQIYNLVPDVLWQLFGLAHGSGEVGMEDTDYMDRCLSQRAEIRSIFLKWQD